MAQAKTETETKVILILSSKEAAFIKELVQNPLSETESDAELNIRSSIFAALNVLY